jgi:hypothetical protein
MIRRVSWARTRSSSMSRGCSGGEDRLFGDFVKHQPMDRHLGLQHLAQVPTDGLALAVFVRRQIQFVGVLEQLSLSFLRPACLFRGGDDIDGLKLSP